MVADAPARRPIKIGSLADRVFDGMSEPRGMLYGQARLSAPTFTLVRVRRQILAMQTFTRMFQPERIIFEAATARIL